MVSYTSKIIIGVYHTQWIMEVVSYTEFLKVTFWTKNIPISCVRILSKPEQSCMLNSGPTQKVKTTNNWPQNLDSKLLIIEGASYTFLWVDHSSPELLRTAWLMKKGPILELLSKKRAVFVLFGKNYFQLLDRTIQSMARKKVLTFPILINWTCCYPLCET